MLIIERFGLNKDDIDRHNLTWIENLKTGSGRESRDYGYISKYERRKCESNALFSKASGAGGRSWLFILEAFGESGYQSLLICLLLLGQFSA